MLNDKSTKSAVKLETMWVLVLTLFFTLDINNDWGNSRLIWYGCLGLVFFTYLLVFGGRIRLKNLSYLGWYVSFFMLGILSMAWSLSVGMVVDVIKPMIILIGVLLLIQLSLNSGFEVDRMLVGYFIAVLINTVYIVLTVDLKELGETQLGAHMLEGWNGNAIGFLMSQGALIGVYLMEKAKRKFIKILLPALVIALCVLTVFTGSRTAFLMLVAEMVLYFCLRKPKKMARNILISVGVVIVAFYLVMTVESFYKVLGVRLEGLFALFGGEGEVDSSADLRSIFIENGKQWFLEQPGFGYGLNNYKVLNGGATGHTTYAHNNFIELAVDLGIIGLIWYYSVYVYLARNLLKYIKSQPLNVYLLSALLASLMAHYGTVAYYSFYQNFLLFLCFYAIQKSRKERFSR